MLLASPINCAYYSVIEPPKQKWYINFFENLTDFSYYVYTN